LSVVPARFHVLTGAPGAGKTSLVEALAGAGFAIAPEGARRLIREGVAASGVDPRTDARAFAAAMLAHDVQVWEAAASCDGPVIFDRGLPDILGFCRIEGIAPPDGLADAIARCRYNPQVFLAPCWPEIYAADAERTQTADEALAGEHMMRRVYPECGYSLVDLPLADIAARVAFVRSRIESG
jgi:predicted ATPase